MQKGIKYDSRLADATKKALVLPADKTRAELLTCFASRRTYFAKTYKKKTSKTMGYVKTAPHRLRPPGGGTFIENDISANWEKIDPRTGASCGGY